MNNFLQTFVLSFLLWQQQTFAPVREHRFNVHYTGATGTLAVGLNGQVTRILQPGQWAEFHAHKGDALLLCIQNPDSKVAYVPIENYGLRGVLTVDGQFHKYYEATK